MNTFFAPAVRLMLRLRFASKFALSGLLLLGLLIYLGVSDVWSNHERVRALQGQREATELMRRLVEWNQVLIDSRHLTITAAVGDTTVRSRFAAQAQVVERKLAEIEAEAPRMRAWVELGPQVAAMRQGWQALRQKVEALPLDADFAQQAFAAHAPEYGRLYGVMRELGDGSGLSLEPDLDLFYLGFPLMNHTPSTAGIAVRMAAYTTLNLRRGDLRPADRVFYEVTDARLSDTLGQVEAMLAQSMAVSPAVKATLGPALTTLKDHARTYQAYVRQHFTTADALQQNQEQAARAAQATIGAAWHLVEQNRSALAALLAQRQDAARLARNTMAGIVALAILLSTYCYLAMYLAIRQTLRQARVATRAMADGHLGEVPEPLSRDEFSDLMGDLRQADHALASTVRAVRSSAEDVATASAQIAQGNGDLSSRTSQQASALQETAAAMEELAATIGNTAQSAQGANDLVERGGSIVGQNLDMMQALNRQMLEISQSSDKIGEIIGVIESIAFQTNILALNAAVEAARAGEQGKGFAVVASEVRALAQKSAGAAKEIKLLIDTSGQQVAAGRSLSLQAEGLLNEMVGNAGGVAQLIKDIALASREQTQGVSQVNQAIAQIDATTQQNAALVEESAAAADGLRVQAHQLVSAVSVFQTR